MIEIKFSEIERNDVCTAAQFVEKVSDILGIEADYNEHSSYFSHEKCEDGYCYTFTGTLITSEEAKELLELRKYREQSCLALREQ